MERYVIIIITVRYDKIHISRKDRKRQMSPKLYNTYITVDTAEIFTAVCAPSSDGKYPVVLFRCPYEDQHVEMTDDEVVDEIYTRFKAYLDNGFVFIYQDCRGTGKSTGEFIPFVTETEDGNALQDWVRKQSFYNGEIYLLGASYTSAVHYVVAPFADDVKGVALSTMDPNYYTLAYLNGFYKIGLHGNWYTGLYKKKSDLDKKIGSDSFRLLPLSDYSKVAFGEDSSDIDGVLMNPDKDSPFWSTYHSGRYTTDILKGANIPVLLTTGFVDIFTQGVIDMWEALDDETKAKSALLVHPYNHSACSEGMPYDFPGVHPDGESDLLQLEFIKYARGMRKAPLPLGKVTYYEVFGKDGWSTDDFKQPEKNITLPLGKGEYSYTYDPADPTIYNHGCTHNFGSCRILNPPEAYPDAVTFYTDEFTEDLHVRGKMKARLRVRSDCEDTCFYILISLCKAEGDLTFRDDINAVSAFCPDYVPGTETDMEFIFDSGAFMIAKGERLRIDITSSAFPLFVPHTNLRGHQHLQNTYKIAHNSVIADKSTLTINYK